jgi:hypothetical protein
MLMIPECLEYRLTVASETVVLACRPGSNHEKRFLVLISARFWVNIKVMLLIEQICKLKKKMISWGINPVTLER